MPARRLAAIMAIDAVGSSTAMEVDEAAALAFIKRAVSEVAKSAALERGGRLIKTTGDGALFEFTSAVEAVAAALAIQSGLQQTDTGGTAFRIGINLGDVAVEDDDLYGDPVNVAVRLEGIAPPGGICVSQKVFDELHGRLRVSVNDLGPQQLKGITRPVQAYVVSGEVQQIIAAQRVVVPAKARTSTGIPVPYISIQEFSNLSGDAEQQYFASGLRDDLIAALLRFSGLVVLSSSAGPQYRSPGAELSSQASYQLRGSVRRSGGRARVIVQLSAPSGEGLWANRYDFDLDDVFAVQDELAQSVPAALRIKVEEHERQNALRKPPASLDAYDYYLRGRLLERSFNHDERILARSMFEAAIKSDPQYARGYLGVAWFEIRTLKWSEPSDAEVVLARAYSAATTALTLDPNDAECHWALGLIHLWKRNPASAVASYERARAICPNHADLLSDMADTLTYLGRHEEAIQVGKTALHLNPNRPDWYLWNVAAGYFLSGDYKTGLQYLIEMAQPGPAYRLLAATYAQLGSDKEASMAAAELLKLNPGFRISHFAAQAPYIHTRDLAHYVEGLRKARLPE